MLNNYPLWKYITLLFVLIASFIYALPNIYGENPVIQITNTHGGDLNRSTLIHISNILKQKKIPNKFIELKDNIITICFSSIDLQFHAQEVLIKSLGENYVIALNSTSTLPSWLMKLGASQIKLGLDLRGGIHFLLKVDMNVMYDKLQEQMIESICNDLHDANISYTAALKSQNHGSEIHFYNTKTYNKAVAWLTPRHPDLIISRCKKNVIYAVMSDTQVKHARKYALLKNIAIIRKRIDKLGISEPLIQQQGVENIVVELPGIQDSARAKEIIQSTATLELRLVNNYANTKNYTFKNNFPKNLEVKFTPSGQQLIIYKKAILTGDHIIDSTYSIDEYNRPQVNIFLDSIGGITMYNFTKNNIGKLIATLLVEYVEDNNKKDINNHPALLKREEIINIATIQSRFSNSFRITGIVNFKEARQLSILLRAGALPAPIQISEEQIIGPTLGLQNITRGLEACLGGLVTSIIFVVILYRKFGFIAAVALIVNLMLIISIMSFLPSATLTMPGIAGIVLTLAFAIDANVLINEYIKEELFNGRRVQQAIYNGYRNALSSIIDANITTLITTLILYYIGNGSIKSFAIITIIGIITSMFTAIVGTRAIVDIIYSGKIINKLSI